ncbi:MAG TPA: hypothetical protein DCY32_08230 [Opitutae bacterium]|nr:hypothetical protein [Opitutae bacterium]
MPDKSNSSSDKKSRLQRKSLGNMIFRCYTSQSPSKRNDEQIPAFLPIDSFFTPWSALLHPFW